MVEWYAIRIKKGHDLKLSSFWFTSKESVKVEGQINIVSLAERTEVFWVYYRQFNFRLK